MADTNQKQGPITLFRVAIPLCAIVAIIGITWPTALSEGAATLTSTVFGAVDWFFMASVTSFLVAVIWLAFGKYGKIKLGKPDEKPEFSTASWLAMLFAGGMGVGLLFWGAAEPMIHFMNPPTAEPGTAAAARQATVITIFHWGLHAWAVYAIGALVLGYFGFRKGTPYLAGSPIRYMFRGVWVEPVARGADLIAVLAVAFGVAGSIAMGVLQFHTGLHVVAGVPLDSVVASLAILLFLFISYMTSAATSLDKGIKWLSNINMALAILLMLFVLFAGPTAFILRSFVNTVSDYTSNLVSLSLRLYPYENIGGWVQSWTLTYFIWWIAWAPFVGIFIARISRGRTIREFVIGVLFAPTAFSIFWFSVYGGTAIHEETRGTGGVGKIVQEDVTVALFSLFDRLPLSGVLAWVAVVLIFIFLVTSVDSATYVLGMLTSRGATVPPTKRKLAWGITLAALGGALMLTDNINVVKAVTVGGALPFALVLLLQTVALFKALAEDPEITGRAEANEGSDEGGGNRDDAGLGNDGTGDGGGSHGSDAGGGSDQREERTGQSPLTDADPAGTSEEVPA